MALKEMKVFRLCLLISLLFLISLACRQPNAPQLAEVARSPMPPPIPTHLPLSPTLNLIPSATLTSTATATYTFTSTPSSSPTSTITNTPRPTATKTITPVPSNTSEFTSSESPTDESSSVEDAEVSPEPSIVAGPTATLPPQGSTAYTIQLSNVDQSYLRSIYERGQQRGNDRQHFSKIGDCHSTSRVFLQPIDQGNYNLGDYAYLSGSISHFQGSYSHVGVAAMDGFHIDTLIDPFWANPNECIVGESRLSCEYRLYKPSIALVFVQPSLPDSSTWRDLFYTSLKESVEISLDHGVIPILTTQFHWLEHPVQTQDTNEIIRKVAEEYNVPLWDFYASSYELPSHADRGNWHLTTSPYSSTDFSNSINMKYGMTIRNLEALQVLDIIMYEVMQ